MALDEAIIYEEQNTSKMTHDKMIDILKGLVFGTFNRTTPKEREALDKAIKILEQSKWIPVSDPLNELPKDRHLLVTVEYEVWPGEKCRYVTELYYDMTEWSEINDAKNAITYMPYPEPYEESEEEK